LHKFLVMGRRLWHQHFTPTSSSWLNRVERFFALLAEKQIKRDAHKSVKELIAAIRRFINCQNGKSQRKSRRTAK
jgi:transposase